MYKSRYCKLIICPNSGGIWPENWFCDKLSLYRWVRLPNSGGMLPVMLLLWSISSSSFTSLDNSGGKLPVIMLLTTSKMVKLMLEAQVLDKCPWSLFLSRFANQRCGYGPKLDMSPDIWVAAMSSMCRLLHVLMSLGIGPVNMFTETVNCMSFPWLQNPEGNSPDRKLLARSSTARFVRFENPRGREPDSLFLKIWNIFKSLRLVRVSGIEPEIKFSDKCNVCRPTKLPISAGIEPTSLFSYIQIS